VTFLRFWAVTHILRVNCTGMAGDRPRQPAHEIFSIKRRLQQTMSQLPRLKEACARKRQREVIL